MLVFEKDIQDDDFNIKVNKLLFLVEMMHQKNSKYLIQKIK